MPLKFRKRIPPSRPWLDLDEASEPSRLRRNVGAAALAVACAGAIALWGWQQGSEGRAIRRLPQAERQLLYRNTLQTLQSACTQARTTDLRGYCRQQAEFIQQFPECDEACQSLAQSQLTEPVR